MPVDHYYAFGLLLSLSSLKKFFEEGDPMTYFDPALDPPLGGSGRKTTTLVRDHHPYQVSSKSTKRFWRRSRKCNSLTVRRHTTNDAWSQSITGTSGSNTLIKVKHVEISHGMYVDMQTSACIFRPNIFPKVITIFQTLHFEDPTTHFCVTIVEINRI